MKIKVCLNNETHRISRAPDTFTALSQLISSIFISQLPSHWNLEYMNDHQEPVTISNEADYAELFNSGPAGNTIIKMFIMPKEPTEEASTLPEEIMEDAEKKSQEEAQKLQELEELEERGNDKPSEVEMEEMSLIDNMTNCKQSENLGIELEKMKASLADLDTLIASSTQIKDDEMLDAQLMNDLPVQDKLVKPTDSSKSTQKKEKSKKKQKSKTQKKQTTGEKENKKPNPQVTNTSSKAQRLEDTITKVIEKQIPKIIEMTHAYTNENGTKPQTTRHNINSDKSVTHIGASCASCMVAPIRGIRYKCLICPNFDLCEECEQVKEHPHALVKMKTPDQPYLLMSPPNSFAPPPLFMPFNPAFMPPPPFMQPPPFNFHNGPPPFRPPPPMYCKPGKKGPMPTMGQPMSFSPFPGPCFMRNPNMTTQHNDSMGSMGMGMTGDMRPMESQKESDSKVQMNFIDKLAETYGTGDILRRQEKGMRGNSEFNSTTEGKRSETEKFYSQETLTKAEQLKQLLPEVDKDVLLMFVDESPKEFDVLDLLANFQ